MFSGVISAFYLLTGIHDADRQKILCRKPGALRNQQCEAGLRSQTGAGDAGAGGI
jgi:hypothetical protein